MIRKDILPNGVRVISEMVPHVQSVSVGVWAGSGARDEDEQYQGISHFLEHMLFKGTETRNARQIAEEFDSIGGQVNAFTDKEFTCYYARVLHEHLAMAVDVLSDMFMNSKLDPCEIEMEKGVVLEEIKRHEDSPDDLVHDMFARLVWSGHPLGRSVLGTSEAVRSLTRDQLVEFMRTRCTPDTIVVAAAGRLDHDALLDQVSRLYGRLSGAKCDCSRSAPDFSVESALAHRDTEQVHFCIGTKGCSHHDDSRYALAVVDTTLGGGMSSRLFQEVRENRGLAYAIGSYSASYSEGGLFAVYGGSSKGNMDEVVGLVKEQFGDIGANGISDLEMTRAKNQIRGALALGQESMSNRMMRIGKSELHYGRMLTIEELTAKVTNVSHDDVKQVADRFFADAEFPMAAIGPFEPERH
ncbi:MAG: insulinase family protein [Armatimonadetes bacterium]|nr:insulinase family protein [Armatimonadota bacterium]